VPKQVSLGGVKFYSHTHNFQRALNLVDVDPVHMPVGDAVQVDDIPISGGGIEGHIVEAAKADGS